jgi:hypothetical protein
MADNNFKGGPGGRLKAEEAKNVNFGFMRPPQRAIAEASTTSVYQPTPEVAESRIYLQNKPDDFKNKVVADVANAWIGNVKNMSPENYKKTAIVLEELNKRHGSPSWQKKEGRASYRNLDNSININPGNPDAFGSYGQIYQNRPDDYFEELAHASQYAKEPIKSNLRAIKGKLFYEVNRKPNVGRYGTPGELEYEAHSEIAPRLWNEFKTIYRQKYGTNIPPQYENRYEYDQMVADTPENYGGKLKFKGTMMPEVKIVAPVKRP